jgi:hypothetical protein
MLVNDEPVSRTQGAPYRLDIFGIYVLGLPLLLSAINRVLNSLVRII